MRAGNNLFGQFTKARLPKSNKTAQIVRFRQLVCAGYHLGGYEKDLTLCGLARVFSFIR